MNDHLPLGVIDHRGLLWSGVAEGRAVAYRHGEYLCQEMPNRAARSFEKKINKDGLATFDDCDGTWELVTTAHGVPGRENKTTFMFQLAAWWK